MNVFSVILTDVIWIAAKSRNSKKKNATAAAKKVELIQKVPSKEAPIAQPTTAVKIEAFAPPQLLAAVKPAPVKPMEPVKPVEPVKPAELVKVADPIKPVEPVVVPSVPPPSKAPELVNHVEPVKEATPEVVKKEATPTPEITPAPQVTNHVADHVVKTPDKEVVEAEDASTVVDGDLTKSGSQLKLKYEYNVGKI